MILFSVHNVSHAELVRAYGVAFSTDAEYLAFNTVDNVLAVLGCSEDLVVGLSKTKTGGKGVKRNLFVAVGSPVVDNAGLAGLICKVLTDSAACDTVAYPECAYFLVSAGEGALVGAQRVSKVGGVKVESDTLLNSPVYPFIKMLGLDLVTVT